VAFDVVRRDGALARRQPGAILAGAVATSSGLVFTGDMRGSFMALDAGTGAVLGSSRPLGDHRQPITTSSMDAVSCASRRAASAGT
jgi:hypothetical protein